MFWRHTRVVAVLRHDLRLVCQCRQLTGKPTSWCHLSFHSTTIGLNSLCFIGNTLDREANAKRAKLCPQSWALKQRLVVLWPKCGSQTSVPGHAFIETVPGFWERSHACFNPIPESLPHPDIMIMMTILSLGPDIDPDHLINWSCIDLKPPRSFFWFWSWSRC